MGAVIAPLVVVSAYLFFSRWPTYRFTTASDFIAFIAALIVGAMFVATFPLRWHHRFFCVIIYAALGWMLLMVYSLCFVGVFFGEWL
jgi:hypothetical protein